MIDNHKFILFSLPKVIMRIYFRSKSKIVVVSSQTLVKLWTKPLDSFQKMTVPPVSYDFQLDQTLIFCQFNKTVNKCKIDIPTPNPTSLLKTLKSKILSNFRDGSFLLNFGQAANQIAGYLPTNGYSSGALQFSSQLVTEDSSVQQNYQDVSSIRRLCQSDIR